MLGLLWSVPITFGRTPDWAHQEDLRKAETKHKEALSELKRLHGEELEDLRRRNADFKTLETLAGQV